MAKGLAGFLLTWGEPVAVVYRDAQPIPVVVDLDDRTWETVRQALLAVLDAANEQESHE